MPYQKSGSPYHFQSGKKMPAKSAKVKEPLFLTEPKEAANPVEICFRETVLENLFNEKSLMNGWEKILHLIPGPMNSESMKVAQFSYGGGVTIKEAKLEEYMDYTDLKSGDDIIAKAKELALRCAGAYNCLVRNARLKGGSDPVSGGLTTVNVPMLMDTLRFMVVESENNNISLEPKSWISFRFRFAYILVEQ